MPDACISVHGLRHEYSGRTVLSVPEWDVAEGDASLVLGPSGSGKSTLLAVIAGLLTPTSGSVRVAGEDITQMGAAARDAHRARHIGLVPQTLHLIGVLSARDNLRLARQLAALPADDGWVDSCLKRVGLGEHAGHKPANLSVGEAQRVAIARAVVNRPALILADEPTSALDDASCEQALALLRDEAAACGATLVVATHDQRIRGQLHRRLEL